MKFLKNLFKNESTVVGLCDLKRRQAINSFCFARQYNVSQPFGMRQQQYEYGLSKF